MRTPAILLVVSLSFLGCKESESGKNRQTPSDGKKAAAPELTVKPMKMTPEQVDSTVRVRVISGGLPPMHYTGALLHSEELASPPFGGRQRHVLALLQGWTKARLKSPEGRVFVVRNRTDAKGDSGTQNIAADLLNLDERTGVATLEYNETPGSSMDVGYRVDLDAGSALGTQAVTSWLTGPESRQANENFSKPPLSVGPGAFESGDGKQGSIHFPANVPANRDRSPLAIAASGMLTGFFGESADDKSSFIPVGDFRSALNATTVRLRAVGIAVGTGDVSSPGALPVWLLTENTSPALIPQSLVLRVSDPNPSRAVGDSSAKEPYAPIEAAHIVRLTRPISGPGIRQGRNALQPAAGSITTDRWLGRLDVPIVDGAESVYRLQLGWSAVPTVLEPSLFGPPFLVRFKREAGILSYKVEGLKRLSEIRSTNNNEEKQFILESPVRDLKEIAGGREVLFQFDGAPYWKRFSLTRNEWLPLPPVDLTSVYLTGNATGLFILERGAAEVRRFALADLSQTASVKLPADKEYIAILAGSISESAPVHLVMKNDVLSLDPNSLQKRGFAISRRALLHRSGFKFSAKDQFEITGEGLSFWSGRKDYSPRHPLLSYLGDAVGLDNGFIRPQRPRRPEIWGTSVAEAYGINRQGALATFASGNGEVIDTGALGPGGSCVQWLSPNSPVVFRLNHADRKRDGAIPATIGCFGYANSTPFAEVETPELSDSGMSGAVDQTGPKWVSFDPYTLRLGVLSTDRKTWVVHQVVPSRNLNQPVLLNWPDSTLAPGGEFRFKPVILGGGALAADLIGNKEAAPVSTTDGTVSFRVAKNELASLLLLKLKLTSAGGAPSYPIPLHVFGPPTALVAPVNASPGQIDAFGVEFSSLGTPKHDWSGARASQYELSDPVQQILGPVCGHLIFVTSAQRLDFFSLEKGKVTGSAVSPQNASYYAGAEALFEYDSTTRVLSRIGVPDGRPQHALTLPRGLLLNALSVGVERGSPLMLVLQGSGRAGKNTKFDCEFLLLDSSTLLEGGWAQPKLLSGLGEGRHNFSIGKSTSTDETMNRLHLPSSHNGRFVATQAGFVVIGQHASVAARYPGREGNDEIFSYGGPLSGSISGMISMEGSGVAIKGGIREGGAGSRNGTRLSPCGRYRLVDISTASHEGDVMEIRTLENDYPLFRIGRFPWRRADFENSGSSREGVLRPQNVMLADNGPLATFAGRYLQLVELDIPRIARDVRPTEFHVTSQCAPFVMEGAALEYQIAVNNPDAVAGYRLRAEAADTSVTPQGLLRYTAPAKVNAPTRVTFTVEILGKDGRTVLHQFPVFVLPTPPAEPKLDPASPPLQNP